MKVQIVAMLRGSRRLWQQGLWIGLRSE